MSDAHLSFETLADFVDDRVPAEAAARVEAHLAGCAACRAEADWLRAALRREEWVTPPARVSASVRAAFRAQARPAPSWLDRLRGTLAPRAGWALATAALLVVLVGGALAWQAWRTTEAAQTAQLSIVNGTVEVLRAGEAQWQAASAGTAVQNSDRLRTAGGSSATLTHFEGSQTQLSAETEITVVRLAARPDGATQSIVLRQAAGETLHRVQPLPNSDSRFEVDTEAAVIAVRGTTFQGRTTAEGVTHVAVAEGVVEVVAVQTGALTRLTAGQNLILPEADGGGDDETMTPARPTSTVMPTGVTATATPGTPAAPNPTQPIAPPTAPPPTDAPPPTPTEDDDDGDDD